MRWKGRDKHFTIKNIEKKKTKTEANMKYYTAVAVLKFFNEVRSK